MINNIFMNSNNDKVNVTSSSCLRGEGKGVRLLLDDGTVFCGKSFGFEKPVAGDCLLYTTDAADETHEV